MQMRYTEEELQERFGNELFHDISEMNPAEIEKTIKCHVQAKIDEYDIGAVIVDVAVVGSTGAKPVRNPEREKPKWEDTITNRMLHWSYTPEQKEEVKKALAAGVPKAKIKTQRM